VEVSDLGSTDRFFSLSVPFNSEILEINAKLGNINHVPGFALVSISSLYIEQKKAGFDVG